MIIPKNKSSFIYDEKNFLNENKTSERMKALYQKQENIYAKYGIDNYVFLVEKIDENIESIEKFTKNICIYISRYFGFSMDNSIIIEVSNFEISAFV